MDIRRLALAGLILLAAGVVLILMLSRRDPETPSGSGHRVLAEHPVPDAVEIDRWLEDYNSTYRLLWTTAETARWQATVDINEANSKAAVMAGQALADYAGSRQTIDRLQHMRQATGLPERQWRQLEQAWQLAARYSGTTPATVR